MLKIVDVHCTSIFLVYTYPWSKYFDLITYISEVFSLGRDGDIGMYIMQDTEAFETSSLSRWLRSVLLNLDWVVQTFSIQISSKVF